MGQHTWFLKDKNLYLKQKKLYEKLKAFENGEIYLDNMELYQLNCEIDEIDEQNNTEYHDLFRTSKRNDDDSYTNDIIFSKKECFEWINNPKNKVSFKYNISDTKEQENINYKNATKFLNEFWDKYPNGVILFA